MHATKIVDPDTTNSKRATQKTIEATGDLTGNKIADKITEVSRTSPQNSSEIVTNETENIGLDRKRPKKKMHICRKTEQIIDALII